MTMTAREALERAAEICKAKADAWLASCAEGSELQAYEADVLYEAAGQILAMRDSLPREGNDLAIELAEARANAVKAFHAARRYEKVRRMTPYDFRNLWEQGLHGVGLDELVDRLP